MGSRSHTIHVYKSTAPNTSTGHVDFTLTDPQLAGAPVVRRPTIRPLQGRAESQPWYVDVLDVGSSFSGKLSSTGGRADLIGRMLQVRRATDASTATKIGTGRITDVELLDDVAAYRVHLEDERTRERQSVIFSTNTTHLYPRGRHVPYTPYFPRHKGTRFTFGSSSGSWRLLRFDNTNESVTDEIVVAVESDLTANSQSPDFNPSTATGNFQYLRLRITNDDGSSATDYPIRYFAVAADNSLPAQYGARPDDPYIGGLRDAAEFGVGQRPVIVSVAVPAGVSATDRYAYLHMMGGPPSELLPLHIGGLTGTNSSSLINAIYTGTYSSSTVGLPRFSAPTGLRKTPLWFRITQPVPMAQWVEENLYRPELLAPTVNADGEVVVKSVALPESTAGITYTFAGTNLAQHPGWEQRGREQVTRVAVHWESHRESKLVHPKPTIVRHLWRARYNFEPPAPWQLDTYTPGADYILPEPRTLTFTNDRSSVVGDYPLDVDAIGLRFGIHTGPVAGRIAREIFNRFGDGPVYGRIVGLSSAESVEVGDWVKINLGTYPNLSSGGFRGGTRIVQILDREDGPDGPTFTYLDGGPDSQPLSAPTVTLSTSTSNPKHGLIATIGSVAAASGGVAYLEIAEGSTQPAAASTAWQSQAATLSSVAVTIGERKSGTKYWARARNAAPTRIPSAWTVSTGKTTQSLTGPSGAGSTGITANYFTGTWTNGETQYGSEVFIDTSTAASFSSGNRAARVWPQSVRYQYRGLASDTTYLWGVRHYDPYGGVSTAASATVATSSGASVTAPTMLGLSILWGG